LEEEEEEALGMAGEAEGEEEEEVEGGGEAFISAFSASEGIASILSRPEHSK